MHLAVKMNPHSISKPQARKIILASQGLHKKVPYGSGIPGIIKTIEHLGYVQLDTISVVERAHHHILWSRLPSYKPDAVEMAQRKSRRIFEYWAHAAAYLPMRDYRYSLPQMQLFRDQKDRWPKSDKRAMKQVLERIRLDGPLMSRDFVSDHKGGSWWDWKPDKWALQRLFLEGHLMVSHREGFQRVYDLPERIIPPGTDTSMPAIREYYAFLIERNLQAQGLAYRNELFHLRQVDHKIFDEVLADKLENQSILAVRAEDSKIYYTLPEHLTGKVRLSPDIHILSPFDNLVIWRNRLKDLFDFDYTLECYLPAHKRQYGYFCLPVLYGDRFIGRLDAKADRKKRVLQVQKMHWENPGDARIHHALFVETLHRFASFNQCGHVRYTGK